MGANGEAKRSRTRCNVKRSVEWGSPAPCTAERRCALTECWTPRARQILAGRRRSNRTVGGLDLQPDVVQNAGLQYDAKVVLAAPCVVGSAACDTTPTRQPPPSNHALHRRRRRRRRRHTTRRAAAGGAAPRRHRRVGRGAGARGPVRGLLLPVRCVPSWWGKRCGLSLPSQHTHLHRRTSSRAGRAAGATASARTHGLARRTTHTVLTRPPGCMQVTSAPARAPSGWDSTRLPSPSPSPTPSPNVLRRFRVSGGVSLTDRGV
jgi:hypothetical protein